MPQSPIGIVFSDKATQHTVGILDRFDQRERGAGLRVRGDVLETGAERWRGPESVATRAFERNVDARDLIEVVEDDERRRLSGERHAAQIGRAHV